MAHERRLAGIHDSLASSMIEFALRNGQKAGVESCHIVSHFGTSGSSRRLVAQERGVSHDAGVASRLTGGKPGRSRTLLLQ